MIDAQAPEAALQNMLLDARSRTLALVSDLTGSQLMGPRLGIVNPPLWEIGHLAWFQERWCLRQVDGASALLPSILPHADELYDSSAVAHDARWDLPLPTLDATLTYMRTVLERVLERTGRGRANGAAYFAELAALHEEMHCEAFTYTRQTLGYAAPGVEKKALDPGTCAGASGDAEIAGGEFMLGAATDSGFVFDNEKWAHPVHVEPFRIARTCVSNDEFLAFVEDGGYVRRGHWSEAGWRWRESEGAVHPVYWRNGEGAWLARSYDAWKPLAPAAAVVHVNWHEAQAYCRWARRRLPTEAEWECAASADPRPGAPKRRYPWGEGMPGPTRANLYGASGEVVEVDALPEGDSAWGCRQMVGNVWEWTADAFGPYPGFLADPYKEYSQPWFGDHKVLRGGCFATRPGLIRNTWRNFYTPDRRDVFAGFRTCA